MDYLFTARQQDLLAAVKERNIEDIMEAFNQDDLKPDETWFDYEILLAALERGYKSVIRLFLNNNCRVRRDVDYSHFTPLYYAVKLGDVDIIRSILSRGASIIEKSFNTFSPLHLAVHMNKFDVVDLMLSFCSFEVVSPTKETDTFLFDTACMRSNHKILKKFIDRGFSVDKCSDWNRQEWRGFTPLHFAVENCSWHAFLYLLDQNANLYSKDSNDLTPVHLAFYKHNNTKSDKRYGMFIETAFSKKYPKECINSVDKAGLSILHIYCTRNTPKIVKAFIENGASINSSICLDANTFPGYTPLHFAVLYNQVNVVKLLLHHRANASKANKAGSTPLHLACEYVYVPIVALLLKDGADPCLKDSKGCTPLHYAFYRAEKNDDLVNLLLKYIPMDANPTDCRGLSHFHVACTRNVPKQIKTFLQHDPSVVNLCVDSDGSRYSGYSPLHFAVDFNRESVVEVLLQRCANVSAKVGNSESTALHLACTHNYTKFYSLIDAMKSKVVAMEQGSWKSNRKDIIAIVKLLLDHGCDIDARDSLGRTPFFYAFEIYNNWLEECEGFESTIVNELSKTRSRIIVCLLEHNADVHTWSGKNNRYLLDIGNSILHKISQDSLFKKSDEIIDLLVRMGQDINILEAGKTPLHVAVEHVNKEQVGAFIKHHANVNAKTSNLLLTPLHIAVSTVDIKENDWIIEKLLKNGSYVDACDSQGRSPLHVAFSKWNSFAVESLLRYGADINSEDVRKRPTIFSFVERTSQQRYISKRIMDSIGSHLKKLVALGLRVTPKVKKCCWYIDKVLVRMNFDPFADTSACARELQRLKQVTLSGYSSLYDVLLKDQNEMVQLVNNDRLKAVMANEHKLQNSYPLYGHFLSLQYERGVARSGVLNPAKISLRYVMGSELPDSSSERIFRYLNSEDIDNLIRAGPSVDSCKRKLDDDSGSSDTPSVKRTRSERE